MKIIVIMIGLCMLMLSGESMAACLTTITATTPATDFIDNADGTVTHTRTGLMWKRCSEGQLWNGTTCTGTAATYKWKAGLQQAKTLNTTGGGYATFTDWRLPNIKELTSITEQQCTTPAINTVIFPATVSASYWSASTFFAAGNRAWEVDFKVNRGNHVTKGALNHVRLVRGGQ